MAGTTWKELLAGVIREDWAREIDNFEAQMHLRKAGKIDEKVFAETRLRRGIYGQRYDNGQRHDGVETRKLEFPSPHTKGPDTLWDAPGMVRIKVPYGGLSPVQMNVLAALAEEYSDAILHITTRQDVQLHFVHIEDTPDVMRRLAAVGITTKEACGNSVRNVTACPIAGVCHTETFDVTPYAKALAFHLMGHPDTQDFGRKFKIAFSGCRDEACALTSMHDLGAIAVTRVVEGKEKRGFELYVGGGLGAVPHVAKLYSDFVPEEELFPVSQAMARVYARLGEKKNRNKARIKFLVQKMGIEAFRAEVEKERAILPADERWTGYLKEVYAWEESAQNAPIVAAGALAGATPEGYAEWAKTNVYRQRQRGYSVATVTLPLGDLSSDQARKLAVVAEKYAGGNVRTTVEQNVVLRWVADGDLPGLYEELKGIGLGLAGAGTILDVTACPGTDTCKLGIASSRGLAGELRQRIAAQAMVLDEAVKGLRIKVSGCFNSCGQHHVADIGFYGNSRNAGGYTVPHFQVVLGGKWTQNAGSYGLALGAVPSKRIPDVIGAITGRYVKEREGSETFQGWCARLGKKALKELIDGFTAIPAHAVDASYYTDWGDPREFSIGDIGVGECAGEVVTSTQFGFTAAESEAFEAQLLHEKGEYAKADEMAYGAMLKAAHTLVALQWRDVPTDAETLVREFKTRFSDTGYFNDRFAGGKFSEYLFRRHESPRAVHTGESAHQMIEEAQLFIEASHACHMKLVREQAALVQVGVGVGKG